MLMKRTLFAVLAGATLAGCGVSRPPAANVAAAAHVAAKAATPTIPGHLKIRAVELTNSNGIEKYRVTADTPDDPQGWVYFNVEGDNRSHNYYVPPASALRLNGQPLPLDKATCAAVAAAFAAADLTALPDSSQQRSDFLRCRLVVAQGPQAE